MWRRVLVFAQLRLMLGQLLERLRRRVDELGEAGEQRCAIGRSSFFGAGIGGGLLSLFALRGDRGGLCLRRDVQPRRRLSSCRSCCRGGSNPLQVSRRGGEAPPLQIGVCRRNVVSLLLERLELFTAAGHPFEELLTPKCRRLFVEQGRGRLDDELDVLRITET